MPGDASAATRAALYAPQTSLVLIHLLTIDHDDMAAPVRFCDQLTDVVSRGDTYTAFPCQWQRPPDVDGEMQRIEMVLDNVSRELVQTVRSISTPAAVTIEIVTSAALDTVEWGPGNFEFGGIRMTERELRIQLVAEQLLSEPFPYRIFTPTGFPLLFQPVAAT